MNGDSRDTRIFPTMLSTLSQTTLPKTWRSASASLRPVFPTKTKIMGTPRGGALAKYDRSRYPSFVTYCHFNEFVACTRTSIVIHVHRLHRRGDSQTNPEQAIDLCLDDSDIDHTPPRHDHTVQPNLAVDVRCLLLAEHSVLFRPKQLKMPQDAYDALEQLPQQQNEKLRRAFCYFGSIRRFSARSCPGACPEL